MLPRLRSELLEGFIIIIVDVNDRWNFFVCKSGVDCGGNDGDGERDE